MLAFRGGRAAAGLDQAQRSRRDRHAGHRGRRTGGPQTGDRDIGASRAARSRRDRSDARCDRQLDSARRDGAEPGLHAPGDDVEKIDFGKMEKVSKLAFLTGYRIASTKRR